MNKSNLGKTCQIIWMLTPPPKKRSSLPTRPKKFKLLDKLTGQFITQLTLKADFSAYVHKQQIDQCQLHCNPVFRNRLQHAGCRNQRKGCSMEFCQVKRKYPNKQPYNPCHPSDKHRGCTVFTSFWLIPVRLFNVVLC